MRAFAFTPSSKYGASLVTKPVPKISSAHEALVKITTTTICGTDVRIARKEHTVAEGLILGHEGVGIVVAVGASVKSVQVGQRVVIPCVTPCGTCFSCLEGHHSQCGNKLGGGWRLGNSLNGVMAEYAVVPFADANLTVVPDQVPDKLAILASDVMSTGMGCAESAAIRLGDSVVVFGLGPVGLCAVAGARLKGAGQIIAVDGVVARLDVAKRVGASHVVNFHDCAGTGGYAHNVAHAVKQLTGGRGVDVALECLGKQDTFEAGIRCLKPGGTISSVGVYPCKQLHIPLDAIGHGLGDHKIVTSLCPGGKDRMRRNLELLRWGACNLEPLLTHAFPFDRIEEAFALFAYHADGVIKIVIEVAPATGTSQV
jgi:threonine dehydrogenase-like Zn-dependent dehydrogenase